MLKDCSLLLAIVFAALCVSACASRNVSADRATDPSVSDVGLIRELDSIVDRAVEEGFGGQVAIMRDGAILYSRAGSPTTIVNFPFARIRSTTSPL